MDYTVSDFYSTFSGKVRLIAGGGGLSRRVIDVGILDYEMEIGLKDRYQHTNFHENQLIISTFLYAKDNPYLISDAIKHLTQKKTSGLVIKNVFRLSIPDSVLRYADSRNFPIFLIESREVYFEKIIYEVNRRQELLADEQYKQDQLALLLSQKFTSHEVAQRVKELCPSCASEFFMLFLQLSADLDESAYRHCCQRFIAGPLNRPGNALFSYRGGALFIYSHENIAQQFHDSAIEEILQYLLPQKTYGAAGISACHLKLEEFPAAIRESIYAASLHDLSAGAFQRYSALGTYQLLFPFCASPEMQAFSHRVLDAILDCDDEYGSHLLEALEQYVAFDCDLSAAAAALALHKNTVRYRLEKIRDITGMDYRRFSDMEQMSLAVKILRISSDAGVYRPRNVLDSPQ